MLFRTYEPYEENDTKNDTKKRTKKAIKEIKELKEIKEDKECFICFEIKNNDQLPIKLNNHEYHFKLCSCDGCVHNDCVKKWYKFNKKCPICRFYIVYKNPYNLFVNLSTTKKMYMCKIYVYYNKYCNKYYNTFFTLLFVYYVYKYLFLFLIEDIL